MAKYRNSRANFFTGTDRFNFQVNQALLDGTQQLKKNSGLGRGQCAQQHRPDLVSAGLTIERRFLQGHAGRHRRDRVSPTQNRFPTVAKFNTESLTQTEQRYQADGRRQSR